MGIWREGEWGVDSAGLLGAQPSAEKALEFGGSYRIPRFIEAGERNSDDIRRAHEVRRIRSYR